MLVSESTLGTFWTVFDFPLVYPNCAYYPLAVAVSHTIMHCKTSIILTIFFQQFVNSWYYNEFELYLRQYRYKL